MAQAFAAMLRRWNKPSLRREPECVIECGNTPRCCYNAEVHIIGRASDDHIFLEDLINELQIESGCDQPGCGLGAQDIFSRTSSRELACDDSLVKAERISLLPINHDRVQFKLNGSRFCDRNRASIYLAAQNGHCATVQQLLERKADVNENGMQGATPLFIAVQNGHEGVLRTLLAGRANVNEARIDGATPLLCAATKTNKIILEALIAAKADVDTSFPDGASPLFIAAQSGNSSAAHLLIAAKADMHQPRYDGSVPLYMALQNGHNAVLLQLLCSRADANSPRRDGATPILWAATHGEAVALQALLLFGGDVNSSKEDGATPVFMSAWNGHSEILQMLLLARADKDQVHSGRTAVSVARSAGHIAVTKLLLANGASDNGEECISSF